LLICLAAAAPAAADPANHEADAGRPAYLRELLGKAAEMKLHEDPYWKTLLHYKWTLTGRKSLVDDPNFFLSPEGKRDPGKELEATVTSLFSPVEEGTKSVPCRFAARYSWLKEKLGIDESRIAQRECEGFTTLVRDMKPESATLVFPTFHLDNPASMFGHTFVGIDTETKSKLLSYAVNYTAVTGDNPGPFYAFLGTFGFYKGYFSSLPYYAKVAEYSDFDFRDIWEYRLAFSKEEVVRMLMHIVELDAIYSDYFFFDENCSYNLLFLFDAARPSLRLTDNRGLWVIPVDTMRRAQKSGLVTGVTYRPSRVTRIAHIASLLPGDSQDAAVALAKGQVAPREVLDGKDSVEDKVRIFDLAAEYLKYVYAKGDMEKPAYQERLISLLGARSGLGNPEAAEYRIPVPTDPLQGHRSNRVMLGAGFMDGSPFQEIRYRPAYHSLIDADEGYIESGQIIFTDAAFRYYSEEKRLQLQGLDIVEVQSLSPRNRFFKAFSWKIYAGIRRVETGEDESVAVGDLNFGGGLSWRIPYLGIMYLMAEPDIIAGPDLDESYAAGMGGTAGLLVRVGSFWKIHAYARDIYYPAGNRHNSIELSLHQRFRVSANNAVVAGVSRRFDFDWEWTEYLLGWNFYF
jgi:hypothetical protein